MLKRRPPEGDWLTRVTAGAGRMRQLWDSGVLAEVGTTLHYAVVALRHADGADFLVMRDVSERLLGLGSAVSDADLHRCCAV